MPAGTGVPEIWLLGSTDASAACAAHFGTALLVRPLHQRGRRGRGDAGLRAGVPALAESSRPPGPAPRSSPSARTPRRRPSASRGAGTCSSCASTRDAPAPIRRSRRPSATRTPRASWRSSTTRGSARWPARPRQVRARLLALADEYGVDELVVVTITHDPKARLRSYELLAEAFGLSGDGRDRQDRRPPAIDRAVRRRAGAGRGASCRPTGGRRAAASRGSRSASSTYAGRRIPTSTVLTPGVLASNPEGLLGERRAAARARQERDRAPRATARLSRWLRPAASARNAVEQPVERGSVAVPERAPALRRRSPLSPWSSARTTRAVSPRTCHSICSQYVTPRHPLPDPGELVGPPKEVLRPVAVRAGHGAGRRSPPGTPPPAPGRRRAPARARPAGARESPPGAPSRARPRR